MLLVTVHKSWILSFLRRVVEQNVNLWMVCVTHRENVREGENVT